MKAAIALTLLVTGARTEGPKARGKASENEAELCVCSSRRVLRAAGCVGDGAFLRRRVVEQVGYLNESLQLSLDYDLWIRIGMSARFGYVPHTLAATRLHPATKTLARRREVYAEILETIRRHFGSVPATWVYAYAKAIAEDAVAPGCACRRLRVSTRLVAATLSTFVAYNRRHPLAGFSGLGYLCARAWSRHWRLRTTTRKL